VFVDSGKVSWASSLPLLLEDDVGFGIFDEKTHDKGINELVGG
jgi:hypothetical protein